MAFFPELPPLSQGLPMLKRLCALLLPVALLFSGCATVKETLNVKKPTASVKNVNVTGMTLDSISLLVDMDVNNPNAFSLATTGFDLDLQVEKKSLATLNQTDSKLSLPAKGTASTSVPVTLKFVDILKTISEVKDKQSFNYAIDAGFKFTLPVLGDVRIPLSYSASLPIPALPKISLASAKLDKVGLSGAKMTLLLDVVNPNSFGLDLNKLDYQVMAGNNSLLSGAVKTLNLKKGESQQLEIPINLGFAEAGKSLLQMLMGSQPVQISMKGNLDYASDLPFWKPDPVSFNVTRQLAK
jgi:LEA14-like dessication related protein